MITDDGKIHIKRYLAGFTPSIAQSISFGIGNSVEATTDTKLQFEVAKDDVRLTSYDFVNDKLIFKANVPDEFDGIIYEAALYSMSTDSLAGESASKLISTFDSDTEVWVDATTGVTGTYFGATSRIGGDSLRHTPAASGTKTDKMENIFLNLSGHSGADKFVFAFNVGNAFTSSIQFKFLTDVSNFYTITFGAQTAGYKILEAAKSTATVTGTPSWENITEIRVTTNSTAGGAAAVDYDGLRIDDQDTVNPEYVLVAREVLSTPFVKQIGMTQEIEFSLDVSI